MRWAALPPSLLLLWFFFASSTGPTAPEPSNRVAAKRAASCEEFTRKLGELFLYDGVEVILATVPDPLTSGLSYSFDLQVDAIQRALAQARYTLERFWLPWSQAPDSGTNCYGYPGFLLGTRAPADGGKGVPEQILVLLVGETPTAGINIAQMHCAKNVLSKADGKIPPNNFDRADSESCPPLDAGKLLGILGPTFSGSAPSLATATMSGLDGGFNGKIVSGSATAEVIPLEGDFQRTVLPDNLVMDDMLKFLASLGAKTKEEVAILVESNTAYGGGLSKRLDGGIHLQVPFPLHVHRLREEITATPIVSSALPADLALPLFQDPRSGAAAIPQFSRTTESYDERVLEDTLQSLDREKIRFIGILATDDQDKLFLARRVRAFCPDATLFTLESSLLLTHPSEARVATGMLVASTYPLIPINQVWTPWQTKDKPEVRQTFGSGIAEGTFNAALVLLKENELADYGMPFDGGSNIPPVWISVVGNGAMWPVQVLPVDPDAGREGRVYPKEQVVVRNLGPGHVSAPWGAIGLFLLATGWVLIRVFGFWFVSGRADATSVPVLLLPFGDVPVADALLCKIDKAPPKQPPLHTWAQTRRRRVMFALPVLFAVVLVGYLGVAWVAATPVRGGGLTSPESTPAFNTFVNGVGIFLGGIGLGAVAFTALMCWAGGSISPNWWPERWPKWWLRWWGVGGALAVGIVVVAFSLWYFREPTKWSTEFANDLLRYERTIGLSNGVTIAVPFLFIWLGIYLTVRTHVGSLVNAPLALHAKWGTPVVDFLWDRESPVLSKDLREASKPRWPPSTLPSLGLLLLAPLGLFFLIYRAPLDSRRTEWLMIVGVCLVLFGLAWALSRAIAGARSLERFLRFFGSGPLRARLEPFFATLPPRQFGRFQVFKPTVRMLAEFLGSWKELRTLEAFRALEQFPQTMEEQLTKDLRRFDTWPAWGSLSFEFLRRAAFCVSRDKVSARWSWRMPEGRARTSLLGAYAVLLVSWALGTIRTFLLVAAALAACLWIAFVSYPQSPHHLLLVAAWLAMGTSLVVGVIMLTRFEHNDVLSAMSRTPAGAVTFDATFLKSVVPLLAGPVLAIVVLQFPQFGRWLAEWAQPLLRAMK